MDKERITGIAVLIALLICVAALFVILIMKIIVKIRGEQTAPIQSKKRKKLKKAKIYRRKEKIATQKPIHDKVAEDEENSFTTLLPREEDDDEPTVLVRPESNSVHIQLISDTTRDVLSAVCNDQITIGRKVKCDIQIVGDKSVSGIHCFIKRMEDDTFYVVDNNSTNGTYLNDRKTVGEEYITTGDTLEIGRTRYIVQIK